MLSATAASMNAANFAPSASYRDFIMGEVRYNSLTRAFPQRAEQLFEKAEKYAEEKYEKFAHMASEEE